MVLYVFLFSSCSRFFFFFMFILLQRNCIRVTTPDQEPEGRNLGQGRAKQGLIWWRWWQWRWWYWRLLDWNTWKLQQQKRLYEKQSGTRTRQTRSRLMMTMMAMAMMMMMIGWLKYMKITQNYMINKLGQGRVKQGLMSIKGKITNNHFPFCCPNINEMFITSCKQKLNFPSLCCCSKKN